MNIFLAILVFGGCFLTGERCLRVLGAPEVHKINGETATLATALGLIVIALFTLTLCASGTLYPSFAWAFLGLLYLSNISGLARLKNAFLESLKLSRTGSKSSSSWFTYFVLLLLLVLFALYCIVALLPPTGQDALVYHLAVPKAYLENHGFINLPNNKYSFFPLLFEMVYLFGMMLKTEPLPQLLGWGTGLLLLSGIKFYAGNQLKLKYWLIPAALFFSTPTFLEGIANAYIDVPAAMFVFFAWVSWDIWRRDGERYRFFLFCIFSAAAVTTKLTVLPVIALGVLGIAWTGRKHTASLVIKQTSMYLFTVLAFVSPWWIRNFLFTGNPVAPFLMQYMGGENINWDADRTSMISLLIQQGTGRSFIDFLLAPWSVTFNAVRYGLPFDGDIGIVWLLMSPALLFVPWRDSSIQGKVARSLALILLVFWLFWFIYFQQIRFLAAPFILLSILIAIGIERMMDTQNLLSKFIPWVLVGGLLFNTTNIFNYWSENKPWQGLMESRDEYLARVLPPYPIYHSMNHELKETDKALFVYMRNYGYLAERPFHSDSFFEAHTVLQVMTENPSPTTLLSAFRQKGWTHLMFDNRFVFGKDSAFNLEQQTLLKDFLNSYAKMVDSENGFYLFRFVLD